MTRPSHPMSQQPYFSSYSRTSLLNARKDINTS